MNQNTSFFAKSCDLATLYFCFFVDYLVAQGSCLIQVYRARTGRVENLQRVCQEVLVSYGGNRLLMARAFGMSRASLQLALHSPTASLPPRVLRKLLAVARDRYLDEMDQFRQVMVRDLIEMKPIGFMSPPPTR